MSGGRIHTCLEAKRTQASLKDGPILVNLHFSEEVKAIKEQLVNWRKNIHP